MDSSGLKILLAKRGLFYRKKTNDSIKTNLRLPPGQVFPTRKKKKQGKMLGEVTVLLRRADSHCQGTRACWYTVRARSLRDLRGSP